MGQRAPFAYFLPTLPFFRGDVLFLVPSQGEFAVRWGAAGLFFRTFLRPPLSRLCSSSVQNGPYSKPCLDFPLLF